jgi:hypothetical protein
MKNKPKKQNEINFKETLIYSLKEYRTNFSSILKFIFLYLGIFILFNDILNSILILSDKRLFNVLINPTNLINGVIKLPFYYNLINILLTAAFFFILLFVISGFINASIKKPKFSFRELKRNAKQRYWKFCLFIIVYAIFIVLFSVLLIIPGIIFGVYWVFAMYIFLDKKEKILPSLKKSRLLVKNNWWKIFGCILLILIAVVILLLGKFIFIPFDNIYQNNIAEGIPTSFSFLAIYSFLMDMYIFIEYLILIPIVILFFKNLYLELEREGKNK